jgi:hypothetical protein
VPSELVLLRLRDPGRSALAKPTIGLLRLSHRTKYGDLPAALERLAAAIREGRVEVASHESKKPPPWIVEELWLQLSTNLPMDPTTIGPTGKPVT